MSAIRSLYVVSDEELQDQIKNNFSDLEPLEEADLSFYAVSTFEILEKFSELDEESISKILEGNNSHPSGHYQLRYCNSEEVKETKTTILDKVPLSKFIEFWEQGEKENFYAVEPENKSYILDYYKNILKAYSYAVNENKGLIFRLL